MRAQVRLVAAPERPPGDDMGEEPSGSRLRGSAPPQPTVLVVEDEVLIRLPVCDYLRNCGYRVLEASSGSEALAILRAGEPIALVFSDVNLAGEMTGFALASWIRGEYPHIRVILTSGVAKMAEKAGDLCDEGPFLEKPYSYEVLAEHIRRLLAADT